MRSRIADALGRAAIAYPFLLGVAAVAVALEAVDRSGKPSDFLGWLLWALTWLGIGAIAAAIYVIPLLGIQFLAWGFIAPQIPKLETGRPGAVLSSAVLAAPWAIAPPAQNWQTAFLVFFGLLLARLAVPGLRPGVFLSDP